MENLEETDVVVDETTETVETVDADPVLDETLAGTQVHVDELLGEAIE